MMAQPGRRGGTHVLVSSPHACHDYAARLPRYDSGTAARGKDGAMEIESDAGYQAYRERVFDFLWREVEPLMDEVERTGHFPAADRFPKFREHGLWGLIVPEACGGRGLDMRRYLRLLAEMSKVGGIVRVILHVHNTAARAVAAFGTKAQKQRFLPRLAAGENSMTFAITEPNAGRARWRSLHPQRRQALHHQRPFRGPAPGPLPHQARGRARRVHSTGGGPGDAGLRGRAHAGNDGRQRPAPRHPAVPRPALPADEHRPRPRRLAWPQFRLSVSGPRPGRTPKAMGLPSPVSFALSSLRKGAT